MTTMRAARVDNWGEVTDIVSIQDIDRPTPSGSDLLVKVRAAGINPIDWKMCEGMLGAMMSPPITPGLDVAGEVISVGEEVKNFKAGDAVYGLIFLRGGAFAEYSLIRESEAALKPASLTYDQAAAVPLSALAALNMINAANLSAGQRVLIHAVAGGVGTYAAQMAKARGAYVIGTASAENEAYARSLGVDEFIDYNAVKFDEVLHDIDVVLDNVGGPIGERSCMVLKKGGILISVVNPIPEGMAEQYGINFQMTAAQASSEQLAEITKMIDAGQIKVYVNHTFKLDQVCEALKLSQGGHVSGKIVLNIAN
jgi:NADPH:quinone reductase-like Zn-dependent oxidoreductase